MKLWIRTNEDGFRILMLEDFAVSPSATDIATERWGWDSPQLKAVQEVLKKQGEFDSRPEEQTLAFYQSNPDECQRLGIVCYPASD